GAVGVGCVVWAMFTVCELSLRQAISPVDLLGRVNAVMQMLFRGLLPVGSICAGALAGSMGMRPTLTVGAVGLMLSSLWLLFSPVRTMREYPTSDAFNSGYAAAGI